MSHDSTAPTLAKTRGRMHHDITPPPRAAAPSIMGHGWWAHQNRRCMLQRFRRNERARGGGSTTITRWKRKWTATAMKDATWRSPAKRTELSQTNPNIRAFRTRPISAAKGSRLKAQGSRLKAQGSRLQAPGSRLKFQGSSFKARARRPLSPPADPGGRVRSPVGCWIT